MHVCETCNAALPNPKARFCSGACRVRWHRAAKRPAEPRACAHCGKPLPAELRQGTRFCRDACRVMHHQASIPPLDAARIADVRLPALESGLLLAAEKPWWTASRAARPESKRRRLTGPVKAVDGDSDAGRDSSCAAKRAYSAARRLIALGLVRRGECAGALVIERTPLGTQLVNLRRGELEAAARPAGRPVDEWRYIYWRDAPRPKTARKPVRAHMDRPAQGLTADILDSLLSQLAERC